ncbi:2-hydroxyglutaryl-CoA dehydratase [Fusobacterium necrophorum subsp. funduliforme]|nr:2-hydroxyglutaryl-CoA dehydratase [Fusobacterium necrophorum subsp. funduliforme]EHO16837.1 hypothetical protein HMPREF9466_02778 [Fusobacterium necrophorum subsp. funduliforme 1_1_36S]
MQDDRSFKKGKRRGMYTVGVDIGSSSSKVVILKDGTEIVSQSAIQSGIGSNRAIVALEDNLKKASLTKEDIGFTVVTGYGRFTFEGADKQISEISCHARGIHFLLPNVRTIIDIGGQDAKAISLDEKGHVRQFFMNDKCAAGTGRFLTVMARVLEISLDEMGTYDALSKNPCNISSTCAVFAESEVISQLAKGNTKEDVIAGVHNSVAHKILGLVYRTSMEEKFAICGGVAQNTGALRAIREALKKEVIVAPNPQLTGALGAAIFAYDELKKLRKGE